MPSTGTPELSRAGSARGAPGAYTLSGPPDSTRARGRRARISRAGAVWGTISL